MARKTPAMRAANTLARAIVSLDKSADTLQWASDWTPRRNNPSRRVLRELRAIQKRLRHAITWTGKGWELV